MKLDYDFHRPMEIYYLYTRPIEEARKVGFTMPCLSMLETELKFIEQSRCKTKTKEEKKDCFTNTEVFNAKRINNKDKSKKEKHQ